jgi:hypothetical protein
MPPAIQQHAPDKRSLIRPRAVRKDAACWICGDISPGTFDRWVADGILPPGRKVDGIRVWDVHKLDAAMDRLFDGDDPDANEWG